MTTTMETKNQSDKGRTLWIFGLCCVAVTLLLSLMPDRSNLNSVGFFNQDSSFFIIYAIACIYAITVQISSWRESKWEFLKMDRRHFNTALVLFSISAFSLNHHIAIFSTFPDWMTVYLLLMHLGFLVLPLTDKIPKPIRYLNFFLVGLCTIMSLYFSFYLLRYAPIGIMGSFFFGVTLHLFVPSFMLATCIKQFIKLRNDAIDHISFFSGILLPLMVVVFMIFSWKQNDRLLHEATAAIITRPDNTLPKWVILSQRLPDNWFTDKILYGGSRYDVPNWRADLWDLGSGNRRKIHDPLVYCGFMFFDKAELTHDERSHILQSQFDARHESQRKLWSGNDLTTSEVLTNIEVFPQYRLAYVEKILHIKHEEHQRWGGREQEAAYTFYLPEGSVATSLSLWIDGKEEKSRLTTKSKADSAYVTIVGRERRDPALMHWQEGNTITVTVFPCTQEIPRQFKIGLTIPLEKRGDNLILKNVFFKGPKITTSYETTVVRFNSDATVSDLELPDGLEEVDLNTYQYTGDYRPYWEISCKAPPLSSKAFSFNGKSFKIEELNRDLMRFDPTHIYLDINKSWTSSELDDVWEIVKDKDVFVYRDQMINLTEKNKDKYFNWMIKDNFSLFPVHALSNPQTSLIVSKSSVTSPSLNDLKETEFAISLQAYLAQYNSKVRLFSLSAELSPFLQTLKEFHTFNYTIGTLNDLNSYLKEKKYPAPSRSEDVVELDISNTMITRDTIEAPPSNAPDHLMRLFAYNEIMKKTGQHYFEEKTHVTDKLIAIANEGYVVSPISSLIVLETIKDYERFDIKENENSLQNAKVSSSGAVPEPHEWALIVITVLLLSGMYFKGRLA